MNGDKLQKLQETHIAIWLERDRAKRDVLMTTIYADNIRFYDAEFMLTGNKDLSDFIDKLLGDAAFEFKAVRPAEATQNAARLYWHINTSAGPLTGMDLFIMQDEKVTDLYVFMDGKPS